MIDTTIIYLTDSILEEKLANKCREIIKREAQDIPIISVSQKPIKDFGLNICVGEIGRSWLNLYKQQLAGLAEVKTKYIAIAEHDCLYTREHFEWQPPRDDIFYYNRNHYLVEWNGNHPELNGMYSRWSHNRKALSQLRCTKDLLIESIEERLYLIDQGIKIMRMMGEPGAVPDEVVKAAKLAIDGSHCHLSGYMDEHLKKFKSELFETKNPNLDIRHKTNFTGPRRGKERTYEIPFWGKFKDIME